MPSNGFEIPVFLQQPLEAWVSRREPLRVACISEIPSVHQRNGNEMAPPLPSTFTLLKPSLRLSNLVRQHQLVLGPHPHFPVVLSLPGNIRDTPRDVCVPACCHPVLPGTFAAFWVYISSQP